MSNVNDTSKASAGDDDDNYEESEPILAYIRMKNDVNQILQNDSFSCIKAGHKILILGTHWGKVHIMDHDGNKIITKEIHETTVNDVTIDSKEEYVASCSDDGKVTIFGICDNKHDQVIEFNRPIKSVELEPNFAKTFSFVTGDTKLVLTEKGFISKRKTTILHDGDKEGIIRNIKWSNDLIAWSNERGVKIYSLTEKRIITFITKDHDAQLRDELYRCSLLWCDADTLAIGWADRFKICKVVRKNPINLPASNTKTSKAITAIASTVLANSSSFATGFSASSDAASKQDFGTHVEIISMVQTDFFICGLAPFKNKFQFLFLCNEKDPDSVKSEIPKDTRPHIRVIEAHPDVIEEISCDAFTIKDCERNRPCDYRLDFIYEEGSHFILSPKSLIKAMPRSFDDHIRWLMERLNFEQALNEIRNAPPGDVKVYTFQVVSLNYIDFLLLSKQYKEAAEWCGKTALTSKDWEEKILIFAKEGKLEDIFEKIPSSNPTLTPAIYEKVLNEFLNSNKYEVFKYLIQKWPCDIYDLKCITNAVLDAQKKETKVKTLLESLAVLYEYQKLYEKSFVIYINLGDPVMFDFLVRHNLFECAFENIIDLINLNKEKAVAFLVTHSEKLNIKRVVEKLANKKLFLHYYLDAVFDKDPNLSRDYHTMQVGLYADFERNKLINFLQNSKYIILAQALKELQERNFIPEVVFVMEKMGLNKKALQLILHAIKDVNQAISFCKRHNDKEFWDDLIEFSLNKPEYLIALLNNIGTHVDPINLIDRIPNGVKIKGLRDALAKILQDYRVQISLLQGSKTIISADCLNIMEKQIHHVKKGISVEDSQKCLICERALLSYNVNLLQRLKIFECSHAYHEDCLTNSGPCVVCSQVSTQNKHFIHNES